MSPCATDVLEGFLPAVAGWFRATYAAPTPAQTLAWPVVAQGENALLVAPTGSGKTLAAFLACLDHLWRCPREEPGVRVLYISPLKALNEDIARNLRHPLDGILEFSGATGGPSLPPILVGVRTGDTSQQERQRQLRKPPDLLITTPESLHLLLTSRARESLRGVSHLIIDEIHALAPNKRGVFLALLLERLEALQTGRTFLRVGLSATQRPLEEVARFLGGSLKKSKGYERRPVRILDAGQRKELDLRVEMPACNQGPPPGMAASVWPAIESRLLELIQEHRSTIVFANNRRVAERLTSKLNEADAGDRMIDDPVSGDLIHSHHGSLSLERRRETEQRLKSGDLKAVVATASLELGIDMGAVELVCQVESPGSVARGLQRVGRAGHLVGETSKGRLLAKSCGDLLESAALARAMRSGRVETIRVPRNCLDVLAQQIVACVAMDRWDVPALFDMVRQAEPYSKLTAAAFESVLELVSGRFALESFRDLQPRISWDRSNNRLHPLPGSAQRALLGGGTIPDAGQFPVHLGDGGPRLGELDEEFVLERRVGESFILGASTWTITAIEPHRVLVSPAAGHNAVMPFWRGEGAHRTAELGQAIGELTRELCERRDDPGVAGWLESACDLAPEAALTLLRHLDRQWRHTCAIPDDRTIVVESFSDAAGELGLAVLTPLGGKVHHALKLALQGHFRARLGIEVAALHGDDGVLLRLPGTDEPPSEIFRDLDPISAERLIREELGESALFGLRFRQNAGRALLLPRPDPGKRTPLWLQRLRARDLLQAVRQVPDFPIVVESYRECLDEDLDLPRLRSLLAEVQEGSVRVVERHGSQPSPFASELVFAFSFKYLYEWDEPRRAARTDRSAEASPELLDPLLWNDDPAAGEWLHHEAVARVDDRLRGVGRPPRTAIEMAEWLRRLGDLSDLETVGPMRGFLASLEEEGRATRIEVPRSLDPARWIGTEELALYRDAFLGCTEGEHRVTKAREAILKRFLRTRTMVGRDDLADRYGLDPAEAEEYLERCVDSGQVVRLSGSEHWADRQNLAEARRLTIALRRRESVAVLPEVFARFVTHRQHAAAATRMSGQVALGAVLEQLQGHAASAGLWEGEILPRRLEGYRSQWLDAMIGDGGWTWVASGGEDPLVAFQQRGSANLAVAGDQADLPPDAAALLEALSSRGAQYVIELASHCSRELSLVRRALEILLRRGLVSNDRFDPLRPAGKEMLESFVAAASGVRGRRFGRSIRSQSLRPEGRWSLLSPADPARLKERTEAWAGLLLERYGVLCRETAAMDEWAPPWRELLEVLDRAELRGEVRRGYFVEGLSGVQFAMTETIEAIGGQAAGVATGYDEPLLLCSLDPANMYGSGAPLDVPLLEGGTARLSRSANNHLVLAGGRPVLIIESNGRRLTGLESASEAELRSAVALLPGLSRADRRVLKVETYNLAPALASPAAPWLIEAGFVRDHPGLTLYDTSAL